jgi:cell division protein FtsI (penicillin-binding protein 3)
MKLHLLPLLFITLFSYGQNSLQSYADSRLLNMIKSQQADNGLIIIKEVATGDIVAKSAYVSKKSKTGLAYQNDSSLFKNLIEPGGLMIPVSVAYLLDNTNLSLIDSVDIESGSTTIGNLKVYDSEDFGIRYTSLKNVVQISSNVGVSKMYNANVKEQDVANFKNIINGYLDSKDVFVGNDITLSNLPFISFGYSLLVSPIQILNFYNRLASKDQTLFKKLTTYEQLQEVLLGVSKNGTSKQLLKNSKTEIATKTGSILSLTKNGYNSKQYLSAIVGYAPAINPKYSCIVIIKCKKSAPQFYGSVVAGPVLKDVLIEACK